MKKEAKEVKEAINEASPEDAAKEARAAELAELRKSLNEAKQTLFTFMTTDTFKALADDVKKAITRLSKKASTASTKGSTLDELQKLFPTVGYILDEFDLFKATKMGRAEMRKKVFYAMKRADDMGIPEQKMWIRFNETDGEGSWILDAVGPDVPGYWTDNDLPKTRTRTAATA